MDNNTDLWALMGKNYKKIVVDPKMSTIFSKIVRKYRMRNQLRWIEEPVRDKFTHKMSRIEKMAL